MGTRDWGLGTREKRIKSVVINLIVKSNREPQPSPLGEGSPLDKNKQCFHTKTPVPSP